MTRFRESKCIKRVCALRRGDVYTELVYSEGGWFRMKWDVCSVFRARRNGGKLEVRNLKIWTDALGKISKSMDSFSFSACSPKRGRREIEEKGNHAYNRKQNEGFERAGEAAD